IGGLVIASLVISRRPVSSQDAGVERARRLLLGGPAVPSAVTAEMGSRPGGGWVGGAVAAGAALLSLFISIQLMVVPATIVVQRIPPIDPLKLEHPIALSVDPPPKNGEAKRSESVTTADAGSEPSNGGAGSDMSDDASESEAERSDGAVPQERPVDATDSAAEDPQRGVDPQHADPGVTADAGEGDGQPTGDGESVGDRESIDLESLDPANSTAEHRKLLGGKVKFVPADQMVLGKPDAPHLLAELFDYTCPHCRRMHGLLEQVRQRYGDSLGIVLLPVPLNAGCNRFVAKTYGRHIYACLYPRLALQVWNGNREAFEDFHKWLMEGDEPPPPGQARDRADRLCQEGGSRQRLSERWIDQHIKASVEVYGVCEPRGLPRLLFPDAISAGAASDVDGLSAILEEHLGIRPVEGATGPADGSDHATGGAKK
ncbi:MAG: thioredoxin domain-containing protein, partial [Pirellulales bacterium]